VKYSARPLPLESDMIITTGFVDWDMVEIGQKKVQHIPIVVPKMINFQKTASRCHENMIDLDGRWATWRSCNDYDVKSTVIPIK
jgi:hypothetical protein